MTVTTCAQCEEVLDESPQSPPEQRKPCPRCGSISRLYKVYVQGTVEAKASLGLKARHANQIKPFIEQKCGHSFFHKAEKWVYRVMRINRDNDHYSELVIDPATNEIVHKSEEPLSKHQGHGSAKKKNV